MAQVTALPPDPASASDAPPAEMRAHRRSYRSFERLVLFAVLHIALVLGCLALAFLGEAPVIGFLFFLGGSLVIIAGFVTYSTSHRE